MTKRTAEAQRTQAENGTGPTVAHLVEPMLAGMTATRQHLLAWVHAHGLAALDEVFREEAVALAGAKGGHQAQRTHHHWGTAPTELTFGGRRVQVRRPRVRRTTGGEAILPSVAAKNPTYAGAVVNGRRSRELDRGTGRLRWTTRRDYQRCMVIQDAHPAYLTWDDHLRLLAMIARNNKTKTYGTGEALLSGLGLLRCGVCGAPMVVQYNNPTRRARGRDYQNTPYVYGCTRRTPDGGAAACQTPAGPHIDRAAVELALFALGRLDLDGLREALDTRAQRSDEARRLRARQIDALVRRAAMLEDALGDAGGSCRASFTTAGAAPSRRRRFAGGGEMQPSVLAIPGWSSMTSGDPGSET